MSDERTVGEILDDDPLAGVYFAAFPGESAGHWWFGWGGKDYGPFDSHEEATSAMESVGDAVRGMLEDE